MEKLKQYAKENIWVVNLFIVLIAIALIIVLAEKIQLLSSDINVQESIDRTIRSGFLELTFADDFVVNPVNYKLYVLLNSICSTISMATLIYVGIFVRRILIQMKEGNPFTKGTGRKISNLSWIVLIGGLAGELAHFIWQKADFEQFMLDTVLKSDIIQSISFHVSVNFAVVIIIFLFIRLIGFVFTYAEELQNLSDETL